MKFGVREIANVVFRAKSTVKIGNRTFKQGQPVLYIDSAKTSTLEGAGTTVYATGGRGNTRLIAWEGEKTLTFTVEDALLSPIGLSVLTGAGLIGGKQDDSNSVHVHMTVNGYAGADGVINIADALGNNETICSTAPIFVLEADADGSLTGEMYDARIATEADKTRYGVESGKGLIIDDQDFNEEGCNVMVDFYVVKSEANVTELQIDAENFAGFYYVEADTLFRRQNDGVDMPANITLPNVKIQSNFTFSMASSGDPSTFTFTMDAFPGYTYFNKTKKVLCVIQVIDETPAIDDDDDENNKQSSVMKHDSTASDVFVDFQDSVNGKEESTTPPTGNGGTGTDNATPEPEPEPGEGEDDGEDPDTGDGN